MELRQLSLFVSACQCRNLSETAHQAGLSLSSVSGTLKDLEDALGLGLLERSSGGLTVTDAGRWLFQKAENLLNLEEALSFANGDQRELRIESSLHFMFGTLSRASAAAARDMQRENPGLHVPVRFASAFTATPNDGTERCADIVMGYASRNEPENRFLFADDWIAIDSHPSSTCDCGTIDTLWLPPHLNPSEEARFRHHCRKAGWPYPERQTEDAGMFERLRSAKKPTRLLAPYSLVAARLSRKRIDGRLLDPPFHSPVVARIETTDEQQHRLAELFVEKTRSFIRAPQPPQDYRPGLRLREVRAFNTLANSPSISVASQRLGLSQPALSLLLGGIERKLGKSLFHRHPHGILPTNDGNRLGPVFNRIAQEADRIVSQARNVAMQEKQLVTIAYCGSVGVCPALSTPFFRAIAEWQALMPETGLSLIENESEETDARLKTGEIGFILHEDISPVRSLACLGRLVATGTGEEKTGERLVLPGGTGSLARILAALPGKPVDRTTIRTRSLSACLELSRNGYTTILPEKLAAGISPSHRPVVPERTVHLKAKVTTNRPLGEAEQLLLSCIRRQFRSDQAESAL